MAVNKSHGSLRRTTWIIVIAVATSFLLCVVEWKFADTNPPREARRISSRSFVNQEIWLQQTSTRWRSASVTGLGQTCTSSGELSSVLRIEIESGLMYLGEAASAILGFVAFSYGSGIDLSQVQFDRPI